MFFRSVGGAALVRAVLSALALFLAGSVPVLAQPAAAKPIDQTCGECHGDEVKSFQSSVHGVNVPKTPGGNGGCTVCHNEGAEEHVKNNGGTEIRNPGAKTANAEETNELCLGCHKGGSKRTHWDTSTHAVRGNSCASCHTMHKPDRVLSKLTQPEVCFTCHKQQRVEVNRMFRHPILEGKVSCSDCHNPHGSIGRALMKRDSVVETCYQCHAEKRGPFVHPHDPVTEDCALCHNPHGTVADNMLKLRPPFLCHQCHTPHGGNVAVLRGQPGVGQAQITGKSGVNYTQGRGCLNCHTQVHGSNNPDSGVGSRPTPQIMFR